MSVSKVAIIGASGYVGAELVGLLTRHPYVSLRDLVVSEHSDSDARPFSELHARWQGICDVPLQSFSRQWFDLAVLELDAVFLATPHEFAATWAAEFLEHGVKVFDLSAAFRLNNPDLYINHYGFEHQYPKLLKEACYGLAEWLHEDVTEQTLFALPGCYPTASLLALKPLTHCQLNQSGLIVVNGTSGVSGAGRNANLATSFNEVSLRPYQILQHRHQPEISQEAGTPVVFNPHLAPFKRGLLATVTLQLKSHVSEQDVAQAYANAYDKVPLVRLKQQWPQIDDVTFTPFADLHWQYDDSSKTLVVCVAIDNLLKGAASQAVQCFNLSLGLPSEFSLITDNWQAVTDPKGVALA